MSGARYTEEFKRDAVSQVKDRGYSVKEISARLGISTKSLYDWARLYHKPAKAFQKETEQSAEIRRLKAELVRVKEERDILRRTSQGVPIEVRLHQGASLNVFNLRDVPCFGCSAQWILRMAQSTIQQQAQRQQTAERLDKTSLARIRLCLCIS